LQLLKTPEERQRRLEEIPEIHADPHMDPSYESEEDEGETDDKRQGFFQFLSLYYLYFIWEKYKKSPAVIAVFEIAP
jgi:hypothetical protein